MYSVTPAASERYTPSAHPKMSGSDRMRTLLEEFPGSGLTIKEFCRQHGVSPWQFRCWRKRLGFRFRRGKRSVSSRNGAVATGRSPGFVRLAVEEPFAGQGPGWGFEVSFPNGTVFRGTEDLALKALDRIRRSGR